MLASGSLVERLRGTGRAPALVARDLLLLPVGSRRGEFCFLNHRGLACRSGLLPCAGRPLGEGLGPFLRSCHLELLGFWALRPRSLPGTLILLLVQGSLSRGPSAIPGGAGAHLGARGAVGSLMATTWGGEACLLLVGARVVAGRSHNWWLVGTISLAALDSALFRGLCRFRGSLGVLGLCGQGLPCRWARERLWSLHPSGVYSAEWVLRALKSQSEGHWLVGPAL